jgi:glyoxylase-like metal-dependent hydrolase (beta-lactamase superfamily II)
MIQIKRIIGGELEANCWIVYRGEGGEAFIIDPGYTYKKYMEAVRELKLTPKGILLTHFHHDHSGASDVLANELGVPVYLHGGDLPYYKGRVDVVTEDGDKLYLKGPGQTGAADSPDVAEPIEILHTPGHTAGGVCYRLPDSKTAFTGDTIFNVDIGYTHFDGGSEEDMKASLKNVVDKWENDVTIYPGHGDPATMKYVRNVNREFLDLIK